jgi:hypothetical protein
MAAFGCAAPTSLVVVIDEVTTEVAAIIDGELVLSLYERLPCGIKDIEAIAGKKIHEMVADGSDEETVLGYKRAISDGLFTQVTTAIQSILNRRADPEMRNQLFDHLILTGPATRNNLLGLCYKEHLSQLLPASGNAGDAQVKRSALLTNQAAGGLPGKSIDLRTVPTYYPDIWQKATPLAVWFGGGITAKCTLGDPKTHYTLDDWRQCGRRIFTLKAL